MQGVRMSLVEVVLEGGEGRGGGGRGRGKRRQRWWQRCGSLVRILFSWCTTKGVGIEWLVCVCLCVSACVRARPRAGVKRAPDQDYLPRMVSDNFSCR
jgi:hypothetical protein